MEVVTVRIDLATATSKAVASAVAVESIMVAASIAAVASQTLAGLLFVYSRGLYLLYLCHLFEVLKVLAYFLFSICL
jgi:hypothetical protein